jgi:alpha-maltose-1-phosphate synthase
MSAGDPFDPRTASGTASNLFGALGRREALAGAISMKPSWFSEALVKARSVTFPRSAWVRRYRLSMALVDAFRSSALQNLRSTSDLEYDAFLQIGAYCNVSDAVKAPIFSYHDNDVLTMIEMDPRMKGTSLRRGYVRERIAVEKSVFDTAERIFAFSEWCAGEIRRKYDVPHERVTVVGAGSNIDPGLVAGNRNYDARHAVFLGYDFMRKGGHDVLAAFSRVHAQTPGVRLTIAGGLPEGDIAPGVRSAGVLRGPAQVAELLCSASFFVMPSIWEPFGIAFLEAMASGLPCIGSDICAMPEIIGDTGIVVPLHDPEQLARAMHQLFEPATAAQLGPAARQRYEQQYGWDKVAARMQGTIRSCLGARAGASG